MQRTLTLDERNFSVVQANGVETESSCLVCDAAFNQESSTNIFSTSLQKNGESLASFILRVLRPVANDLRGSHVCSRCNQLFQMLEQAQRTVSNIRCEILKVYHSREKGKVSEEKTSLTQDQFQLFVQSNNKAIMEDDRFHIVDEFRALAVQSNEDGARSDAFHGSPNVFSNHNIEIDNDKKIPVNSVYESKIRNEPFAGSSSDFCHMNIGIDNGDKELEKSLEITENSVFRRTIDTPNNYCNDNIEIDNIDDKIKEPLVIPQNQSYLSKFNCLKAPEAAHDKIGSRSDDYRDSASNYCNLNMSIDNVERRFEKIVLNPEGNVYERKIGCFKAERSFESPEKCEVESRTKNYPTNLHDLISNELLNSFIEGTTKISTKAGRSNSDKSKVNGKKPDRNFFETDRNAKYSVKPFKYPCSTCGKKWRTSAELKTHVKTHSNLRPYMCEICGQAYKHKQALEIHIGMHKGTSPYQCNVCCKCFTQKGALMRHLPIHTGEMPYQCELCGKRFVHHTSYNMHALSHTGKKSYQCHVCNLSLLSTSHLKRHMRVHTGEKPFSCDVCGKSFAERYNLYAHHKIHEPPDVAEMAKGPREIAYQ